MKTLTILLATFFTLSLFAFDADARRLGGARSIGKQREAISPQQAAPKTPAQQQAAAGTPAQQPAGASKWLGPLAGLALGAGLAALFLNNGLAGALAGILMIAALIAAAMFVMRLLRAKTPNAPLQYAGAGAPNSQNNPIPNLLSAAPVFGGGAGANSVAATAGRWPAGFDADEFARHAKLNFVRLQAAHDARDLSTMRDFLAPQMYTEIEADIQTAGDAPQKTDVVTLNSEVLDVVTDNSYYLVSVRFTGLIRETAGAEPQQFSEIWHLEKPVDGQSGWLIAGIQQG
ncbi:MAG: Tim44-like domain-containing protein [Pseudomonadota bacterium]